MSELGLQRRYCTYHERWFVMRRNTGHPFTITVLVSFPILPSDERIQQKITELLLHFAHLNSCLKDTETRKPYWEERSEPGTILNRRRAHDGGEERVLAAEQQRMEKEDFEGRPLWQVTPYITEDKGYIAVSALHELIDGRGLLRLVHALLSDVDLPHERLAIATYSETVDLRPSWYMLLSFALTARLYPWLPGYQPLPAKTDLPGRTILLDLPPNLVDLLKSLGRFHGIPSLTPTLFTAWLAVSGKSSPSASIAFDERSADLGHSYCTGLYHASHLYSVHFPSSFWNTARNVALHIASPASLKLARQQAGLTAWVPDGEVPATRRDDRRPTAWEDWQLEHESEIDVSFSNLGRLDLPPGADGLVVASSASIGDPPIKLVLTGTRAGIRIAVTFRGNAEEEEVVRATGRSWIDLLGRLVSGRGEDIQIDP